jgi:hypothetical protein
MKKEFCTYEQALALKDLGFDEPCFGWYVSESHGLEYGKVIKSSLIKDAIIAPTYSQAFRWFREKHNLHSYIEGAYPWFRYYVNSDDDRWEGFKHLTHEEAESACLDELIEIVRLTKP